jgi:hypothetical protein
MKNFIFSGFVFTIMIVQSCTTESAKQDEKSSSENPAVAERKALANKIFRLSNGMDTVKCEELPSETDYFESYLFIDDSSVIKAIYTCCPNIGEDFAAGYYCKGKYSFAQNELTVSLDPLQIVYYVKESEQEGTDTLKSETHVETEKLDASLDKFSMLKCKGVDYFKINSGSWEGQFLTPGNTEAFEDFIKQIKKDGVWEKLFPDK